MRHKDAYPSKAIYQAAKSFVITKVQGVKEKRGECFSTRQYASYKMAAGKTAKSILVSCSARLAPFDIPKVRELLSYSEADQILGRYLIDPAEIGRLERDECLVLITGLQPFKSKKCDCTKHPRYGEIASR